MKVFFINCICKIVHINILIFDPFLRSYFAAVIIDHTVAVAVVSKTRNILNNVSGVLRGFSVKVLP